MDNMKNNYPPQTLDREHNGDGATTMLVSGEFSETGQVSTTMVSDDNIPITLATNMSDEIMMGSNNSLVFVSNDFSTGNFEAV